MSMVCRGNGLQRHQLERFTSVLTWKQKGEKQMSTYRYKCYKCYIYIYIYDINAINATDLTTYVMRSY